MRTLRLVTWLALILCIAGGTAGAEDWPKYRHDRLQSAVSTEDLQLPLKNVWYFRSRLVHVAPKDLPVRSPEIGRAFGASQRELLPYQLRYSLAISSAGDAVFAAGYDGRVLCIDAATGRVRWDFVTGGAITCTPNYSDGKLYAGSDDGNVYCLDAKTGALLWKHDPVRPDRWLISFGRMSSVWPVRTDILIDEGVAYFGSGIFPHEGMFVNALDVKSQERKWRSACYGYGLAGHSFLSKSVLILPTGLKGFHGHQLMFTRSSGAQYRGHWDDEVKANRELLHGGGGGVVVDGVRYTADHNNGFTARIDEDERTGQKRKTHWYKRINGMLFDPRQTAYAGGVFYLLGNAYEHRGPNRPPGGTGGAVYAVNPKDGQVLWSATIPERTHQLAIANGRLFVSTRQGSIYCYAPEGTPAAGVIDEPVEPNPFVRLKPDGKLEGPGVPITHEAWGAGHWAVERMFAPKDNRHRGLGLDTKGFALVFDCTNGFLPYLLAKRSNMYICAVFGDEAKAQKARELYARANLHCSRISVLIREPGQPLPYPPRFADLIVSEQATLYGRMPRYTAELDRLLKPVRGVALVGGRSEMTRDGKPEKVPLDAWVKAQEPPAEAPPTDKPKVKPAWKIVSPEPALRWARRTIPALKNAGGWTHARGSAGNTMSSHDSALKPPLGMAWYGAPHTQHARGRPPLLLNGVLVCPIDSKNGVIEAYDAYNGRKLWRYDVPRHKGHEAGRNVDMMALGGNSVFIPDGNVMQNINNWGIVRLDLWTGKVIRTYQVPYPEMRMGDFAVSPDGKTMWRSGYGDKTKTRGDWTCLYAMDTETGKILWTLGGPGKTKPFGLYGERVPYERWAAIDDGRIFILRAGPTAERVAELTAAQKAYYKENDPEVLKDFKNLRRQIKRITALDAMTGEILYNRAVDVQDCNAYVAAHNGKLLFLNNKGEKWWGGFGGGAFRNSSIAVHDAATGKFLWKRKTNHRFDPVIGDEAIYAEPWTFDLATGKKKRRAHPVTGVEGDYAWVRYHKQCGNYNGSTHFVFGRSKGFGYFDVLRDNGFYISWHHRQNCNSDTASGSGMMIKPPFNADCGCPWSLPYTIAMTTMPEEPAIPYTFFQQGRCLPVKELRLNFGASGDRRDKAGALWLNPAREHHPSKLQLMLAPVITYYGVGVNSHGGANTYSRQSASDVPAANTSDPFLFDAYALGLQRCVVPVTTPDDGKGTYTVRLGFSALPGDKPGQRVFDVLLNGKRVLKGFDIVKEAGAAHSAVWKEFTLSLADNLVLDLVAKADKPTMKQMPLINAMEILRKEIATLGLKAPKPVWLNEAKPEKVVTVHVANHRNTPFTGKLVVETDGGIVATLPDAGTVMLQPATRKKINVSIKNTEPAKTGSHTLTVKLVSDTGKVETKCELTVDCLGKLERMVQRGSGRWCMTRTTYETWTRRGSPAHYVGRFPASKGARESGDLGAACSWVKFHVPQQVGRIDRLRVRLHYAPQLEAAWRAMFGRQTDPGPRRDGWGRFRLIDSKTDVNVDSLKYPDLPKLKPGGYPLKPAEWDPNVVEATLPTDIPRDTHGQGRVQLVLEPTALDGPVYWSTAGLFMNPENAPALVIDYEPAPPRKE